MSFWKEIKKDIFNGAYQTETYPFRICISRLCVYRDKNVPVISKNLIYQTYKY